LLRVAFLAFALVIANSLAAVMMNVHAESLSIAPTAAHHCHEMPAKSPAGHGSTCPCCSDGCFCLHGSTAPLPEFVVLRPNAPGTDVPAPARVIAPDPSIAEQLRPPIV
jgi:hypothetical protein